MQETNVFTVLCERQGKSQKFQLSFPYHQALVNLIKELPHKQRNFNPYNKSWTLDYRALLELMKKFKGSNKIFFDFGSTKDREFFIEKAKKYKKEQKEFKEAIEELERKRGFWVKYKDELEEKFGNHIEKTHKNLKEGTKLFPHQVVGAMFLNEVKNALISLEMGLGKSILSIAYVEMNDFEKVMVITPNSLKFNFYGEVEKFTNSKVHIVNWKKNKYTLEESKYIIVNYEFFNPSSKNKMDNKFAKLNLEKIDCLIADECQKIKNTQSNTYKNFKRIFKDDFFKGKPSKVFLSGTPAPNRAYELYSVLNQISPIHFATKKHFYEYYCGMKYDLYGGMGWITNIDNAKFEELYHKIAPFTYRKRKKEVLKDLPDKVYQKIVLELSSKQLSTYYDIEDGVANEFVNEHIDNPLTKLVRLRQFTASLKVSYIKELIDSLLDEGEKIVIVDYFKEALYKINEMYPEISALHTGEQTPEERSEIINQFQNPKSHVKIFLGSIQTCNYGLTLTAASKLFIITLPFSVGEYDQVADRCHRIGQKDTVNIYPLIFMNTIDEDIFGAIENKRKEISKAIDNEDYKSDISESVIKDVIKKIKQRHG